MFAEGSVVTLSGAGDVFVVVVVGEAEGHCWGRASVDGQAAQQLAGLLDGYNNDDSPTAPWSCWAGRNNGCKQGVSGTRVTRVQQRAQSTLLNRRTKGKAVTVMEEVEVSHDDGGLEERKVPGETADGLGWAGPAKWDLWQQIPHSMRGWHWMALNGAGWRVWATRALQRTTPQRQRRPVGTARRADSGSVQGVPQSIRLGDWCPSPRSPAREPPGTESTGSPADRGHRPALLQRYSSAPSPPTRL